MQNQRLTLILCALTILSILQYMHLLTISPISSFFWGKSVKEVVERRSFVITSWTPHIMYGNEEFKGDYFFKDCVYKNCLLNFNKTLVNQSELVLFEWAYIRENEITLPPRQPNQLWAFLTVESPARDTNFLGSDGYSKYRGIFNLTMTYRLDSSIPMPYFIINFKKRDVPSDLNVVRSILKKKTKIAAWFVSNKNGELSGRNIIVEKLIQYGVQVDVYGENEKYKCPKNESYKCIKKLQTNYKFYLAFENSNCKDYITEKLFKVLSIHVVPVVLGGGNYRSILPREAYIDVADFKSVEKLAQYLISLDKDDEKYLRHLSWRTKFDMQIHNGKMVAFCNVCKKLNEGTLSSDYKTTSDIEKWWHTNKCLYNKDRFHRKAIDTSYRYI